VSNGKQVIVGKGRGGTFEQITLRGTILGIVIPLAAIAAMRLVLMGLLVFIMLMIGRYAGGILAFGVGLYSFITAWRRAPVDRPWLVFVAFAMSLVLILIAVFNYWPDFLLMWVWVDGQMYVSLWGHGLQPASPLVVGLRIFLIFAVPLAVWTPWQWTEWALSMEMRWPKLREVPFATADPGSVRGAGIRAASGSSQAKNGSTTETLVIPSPDVEGK